jgi:hypothetical protein
MLEQLTYAQIGERLKLLFTDDDVRLEAGWLAAYLNRHLAYPNHSW